VPKANQPSMCRLQVFLFLPEKLPKDGLEGGRAQADMSGEENGVGENGRILFRGNIFQKQIYIYKFDY
jgi:hypothetical protein